MKPRCLINQFPILICFTLLMLNLANRCLAETPAEKMQKILTAQAGFADTDLKTLNQGEPIAKLLSVKDEGEVAVCGITNVNAPLEITLKAFQDTMSRQNKSSVIDMGDFSSIPVPEDLQGFKLEKGDVESLKKCVVGNCDFRLSAAMIERFQKEVDWSAADYSVQTNLLFRKILLEYLQDYLLRGNEALIEYNHQRKPISLRQEHRSLLNNLLWIHDFAPEFAEYLQNFPHTELPNVRKSLTWSKLKFGLKPVMVVTQTITYMSEKDGVSQILSVSKQIYASRYFDSSLGLTALIKFPKNQNAYLFYANHSRSSALEGMFSNFKREIVEREAMEKIKPLLEDTKSFAEAKLKKSMEADESSNHQTGWFSAESHWIWIILSIILAIAIFGVGRKLVKK